VIATIHGDIKAAKRHAYEINRLLRETNFSDSTYQIKIEPAKNENGQFFEMLMAEELDSKNLDNAGFDGQLSFGEDTFYQKYEQKIKLLTDKFMQPRDEDEQVRSKNKEALQKIIDDAGVSEAEKKSAVDAMVKLTENAQMEEDAQMMLEAKGFKNAVVSLSDECCDVIVGKDDVTDEKRAQIEDIIKRKTNIGASNIVISTMD